MSKKTDKPLPEDVGDAEAYRAKHFVCDSRTIGKFALSMSAVLFLVSGEVALAEANLKIQTTETVGTDPLRKWQDVSEFGGRFGFDDHYAVSAEDMLLARDEFFEKLAERGIDQIGAAEAWDRATFAGFVSATDDFEPVFDSIDEADAYYFGHLDEDEAFLPFNFDKQVDNEESDNEDGEWDYIDDRDAMDFVQATTLTSLKPERKIEEKDWLSRGTYRKVKIDPITRTRTVVKSRRYVGTRRSHSGSKWAHHCRGGGFYASRARKSMHCAKTEITIDDLPVVLHLKHRILSFA